ncbi:Glutamate receptor [Halotydeus destructor]|nr:Glutamate receptor [Halotydeus destructor]
MINVSDKMKTPSSRVTILVLFSLILSECQARDLNVVVTYSEEQASSRDGVLRAIDETFNATNTPVQVRLVTVDSQLNKSQLCHRLYGDGTSGQVDIVIDVTFKENAVKELTRAIGVPTISSNPDAKSWKGLSVAQTRYLVQFEPPALFLVRTVRAVIDQYQLNKYRILYDENYADVAHHLKAIVPEETMFQSLEELAVKEGLIWGTRKLWKFKKHSFITLANVDLLNEFTDAINENDMFRAAYRWFFFTNDKRKIVCNSCKHATYIVVKPSLCNLHDYEGTHFDDRNVLDKKVDMYFFYDLTRMAMKPVTSMFRTGWPQVSANCDSLSATGTTDLEAASKPDLLIQLEDEVKDFHGKYGEFVVVTSPEQTERRSLLSSYQDIVFDIAEINYLRDARKVKKVGKWFYEEPFGTVLFKSALGDDDDEEGGKDEDEEGDDDEAEEAEAKDEMITFIVYHHPPFIFIDRSLNYDNKSRFLKTTVQETQVKGFSIDLLKALIKRYEEKNGPFPKHVIDISTGFTEGHGFGYREMGKTGATKQGDTAVKEFNGIVKELVGEESMPQWRISLLPMTKTPERLDKVDFGEPYFETVSLSILMKKPILQYHFFKFITVLEYSVWICITGAYFFTSTLLWIFDRTSPYSYQNNQEKYKDDDEKRLFTLKESLWFCITSLTPQGGGEAPKALSGRLVAATWWLFGFIIIASYTANLAAFLTVSRLEHKIESLHDLSKQYKTKYAPFEGSSTKTYFERMARIEERFYEVWKDLSLDDNLEEDERAMLAVWDYPVSDKYTKIWAQMSEAKFPVTYEDAIAKIKQSKGREGFALIAETTVIDYAVRTNCDLMKVGGEFNPRPNSFAYGKSFSDQETKDKLNELIVELRQDGTVQALKDLWWYEMNPEKVCPEHRKMYNGISLKNVGGVFLVIAAGMIVSVIMLHAENYYYEKRKLWDAKKARLQAIQGANAPSRPPARRRRCIIL